MDEAWVSAACSSVAPRSLGSSWQDPTAAPQRCPGNGGGGLGCRMEPRASLGFKERGTGPSLPKTAALGRTEDHIPCALFGMPGTSIPLFPLIFPCVGLWVPSGWFLPHIQSKLDVSGCLHHHSLAMSLLRQIPSTFL